MSQLSETGIFLEKARKRINKWGGCKECDIDRVEISGGQKNLLHTDLISAIFLLSSTPLCFYIPLWNQLHRHRYEAKFCDSFPLLEKSQFCRTARWPDNYEPVTTHGKQLSHSVAYFDFFLIDCICSLGFAGQLSIQFHYTDLNYQPTRSSLIMTKSFGGSSWSGVRYSLHVIYAQIISKPKR